MNAWQRWLRFNGVGAAGVAVQLVTIAALVEGAGADYRVATAASVTAAVVHNFAWHLHWTWADRPLARSAVLGPRGGPRGAAAEGSRHGRCDAGARARLFARFAAANGAVSLVGNLLLVAWLAGTLGVPVVPASAIAIVLCGLANYWVADTAVFSVRPSRVARLRRCVWPRE